MFRNVAVSVLGIIGLASLAGWTSSSEYVTVLSQAGDQGGCRLGTDERGNRPLGNDHREA